MEGVSFGLKKRGKRRRGIQAVGNNKTKRAAVAAFDGSDESDSSQPRAKAVSRVVVSAPTDSHISRQSSVTEAAAASKREQKEISDKSNLPKQSQIARLVARRRTAEEKVEDLKSTGEANDGLIFRHDVDKCPDHSTMSAYRSTPIDGFGVKMLKAMGWKGNPDDVEANKKTDDTRRAPRPARLGFGAKLGELPIQSVTKKQPRHLSDLRSESGSANGNNAPSGEQSAEEKSETASRKEVVKYTIK